MNKLFEQSKKPELLYFKEDSSDDGDDSSMQYEEVLLHAQPSNNSARPIEENDIFILQSDDRIEISQQINQAYPTNKPIDSRIQTVRVRIIIQKPRKELLLLQEQKMSVEVKAKDLRFKEIGKQIFIFYSPSDLFRQLEGCSFLNGFKGLNEQHMEKYLLQGPHDKKFNLTYYFTKNEEGEYHGQINSNKTPDGNGIIYYKNGNTYIGAIKNRSRNGEGTLYWPNGSYYCGTWKQDAQHGIGISVDALSKEKFEGTFVKNIKEGRGKLTSRNGDVLECMWKNGVQDGESTLRIGDKVLKITWQNGQILEVDGKRMSQQNQNSKTLTLTKTNNNTIQLSH